jgi:hypothetical protein
MLLPYWYNTLAILLLYSYSTLTNLLGQQVEELAHVVVALERVTVNQLLRAQLKGAHLVRVRG